VLLAIFCVAALGLACGGSGDDRGPSTGDPAPEESSTTKEYNNHVKFECGGDVLVDETFTSKAACEAHARSHIYSCNGVELPISC
jgi:hypothetical protein